jgi:competence protein CoiA
VTCARAAGFQAELEVAAPTGEWRADVMVFRSDGTRLMALEAQLSPITVEDIAARTSLYVRDGVRVCWFGFRPRPWVGSVPTLLVQAPEERGQAWGVTARPGSLIHATARLAPGHCDAERRGVVDADGPDRAAQAPLQRQAGHR